MRGPEWLPQSLAIEEQVGLRKRPDALLIVNRQEWSPTSSASRHQELVTVTCAPLAVFCCLRQAGAEGWRVGLELGQSPGDGMPTSS